LRRRREGIRPLPLRAMYSMNELAGAASMDRRTLKRMLDDCGVEFHPVGRVTFIRITELRDKASPIWEAIQTVQALMVDPDDPLQDPYSGPHL
jgi:hypothetical protein